MYSPGTFGAPISVNGSKYTARGALLSEGAMVDIPRGRIEGFQAIVKGMQSEVGTGGTSIRSYGTFERRPKRRDIYTSRASSFQTSLEALPGTTATTGSRGVFGDSRAARMQTGCGAVSRSRNAPQQRFPETPT